MEENKEQVSVELQLLNAKNSGAYNLTPAGQMYNQFVVMQRMGQMYSASTIIPDRFKNNIGDCVIAIDMAQRMGANPLMVMQNLYVVYGNPSFSSKFLIATINASGKFSTLNYEFKGTPGQDDWGCRVVAFDINDKEFKQPKYGDFVDIKMAKDEGWYDKKGSKWRTMPAIMLRYRAAAFWQRVYCPEISMGLSTKEEYDDAVIIDEQPVRGKKKLIDVALNAAESEVPQQAENSSSNETSQEQPTNPNPQTEQQSQETKQRKTLL